MAKNGTNYEEGVITIGQSNPDVLRMGYSTLYQFGRKDAFPGTDATAEGSFTKDGGDNMSIQNGIQHPETFYTWGSSWINDYSQYNLWSMDNTNTVTGYNDNAVVKTVYDPCPAGFHMPASNAFTGFTTTGQNAETRSEFNISGDWGNHGWNFKAGGSSTATVYFPAAGWRYYGSLVGVGSLYYGKYWSAVPLLKYRGCYLGFDVQSVNLYPKYNYYRSYGMSVRPVAE